jgi:hypothetical protein
MFSRFFLFGSLKTLFSFHVYLGHESLDAFVETVYQCPKRTDPTAKHVSQHKNRDKKEQKRHYGR